MSSEDSYKDLRAKLDEVLERLDSAESSDIDMAIKLHHEALALIDQLEASLKQAAKTAKGKGK